MVRVGTSNGGESLKFNGEQYNYQEDYARELCRMM